MSPGKKNFSREAAFIWKLIMVKMVIFGDTWDIFNTVARLILYDNLIKSVHPTAWKFISNIEENDLSSKQ